MTTRAVTDSVVDVLEAGGLTVGDSNATSRIDGQGSDLEPPFVVVYPLGVEWDGSIGGGAVWAEQDVTVQVTCVGGSRSQAEWLADRTHELMLAADEGWRCRPMPRPAVVRDDDTGGPPLFYAYARFALHGWT